MFTAMRVHRFIMWRRTTSTTSVWCHARVCRRSLILTGTRRGTRASASSWSRVGSRRTSSSSALATAARITARASVWRVLPTSAPYWIRSGGKVQRMVKPIESRPTPGNPQLLRPEIRLVQPSDDQYQVNQTENPVQPTGGKRKRQVQLEESQLHTCLLTKRPRICLVQLTNGVVQPMKGLPAQQTNKQAQPTDRQFKPTYGPTIQLSNEAAQLRDVPAKLI